MTRHDDETTAFGSPPPDPELRRLQPLVGTWRSEEQTLDGVLGPGVSVTSAEGFSWLEYGTVGTTVAEGSVFAWPVWT